MSVYTASKICSISAFFFCALPGFGYSLNCDDLLKLVTDRKSSQIQKIEVTNGVPVIGVRFVGSDKSLDVAVPDNRRKELLQMLVQADVSMDVRDGPFVFPALFSHKEELLTFSQLRNLVRAGHSDQIERIYSTGKATLAVRMIGAPQDRDVVCPLELKQDLVDELQKSGVKLLERRAEKPNFLVIESAFFLALALLGTIFVFARARR